MTRGAILSFGLGSLVACILTLIAAAGQAQAHAVLLRTTPPGRETLPQAPSQISLLFSEPIDPVFTAVQVRDATEQRVDLSDAHVDVANDHLLVASLRPGLPSGVYTVSWRSLSTIDVHPDEGTYSLFVGVPVSTDPRAVAQTSTGSTATVETTVARWWFYLAASLFGGVLACWKLVLSGVLGAGPEHAGTRSAMSRRARRAIVLGGIMLILGTLFAAVAQAAAAANVSLLGGVGQPLSDLLLRGRYATIWWPRLGLEAVSLALIAFGGVEGLAADCALATLPAVLLTSSLTSHGAALTSSPGAGIIIDWVHIVGATAWVGGLLGLLVFLPVASRASGAGILGRVLEQFFRYALAASALVIVSGSIQSGLELGSLSALIGTGYGQLILAKIGLVALMLVLAIVNEWRGRRAAGGPVGLRRGIRAELFVGALVLAVAAILSGTPPNRPPGVPDLAGSSVPLTAGR